MKLRLIATIATQPFKVVTGTPKEAWPQVKMNIAALISTRPDMDFKIGRTNDSEERERAHDCEELQVLYSTNSVDLIKEMEEIAINEFKSLPNCINDAEDSRGNVGEGTQYLYIAFWD